MQININLFDFLYYDTELPLKQVAEIMDVAESTLYVSITKTYGRKLRTISEANFVAIKKGRWKSPNEPLEVDWENVRQLRREGMSFTQIGKAMGYAQGHNISKRARRGGYLEDRI